MKTIINFEGMELSEALTYIKSNIEKEYGSIWCYIRRYEGYRVDMMKIKNKKSEKYIIRKIILD